MGKKKRIKDQMEVGKLEPGLLTAEEYEVEEAKRERIASRGKRLQQASLACKIYHLLHAQLWTATVVSFFASLLLPLSLTSSPVFLPFFFCLTFSSLVNLWRLEEMHPGILAAVAVSSGLFISGTAAEEVETLALTAVAVSCSATYATCRLKNMGMDLFTFPGLSTCAPGLLMFPLFCNFLVAALLLKWYPFVSDRRGLLIRGIATCVAILTVHGATLITVKLFTAEVGNRVAALIYLLCIMVQFAIMFWGHQLCRSYQLF